jgi:anaerobic selenocysteine-containing dehydrogenase
MSSAEATVFRTCPLCEATCGLELTIRDGAVTRIRGDSDDVFSHGFICPKGTALGHLHDDPDRLRAPMVRRDGDLRPAPWEEAFAEVAGRLPGIIERHGRDAVAVYLGNPNVHNLSGLLYGRVLLRALGTRNLFTASTVDQRPKEISSALMFGTMYTHAVPDLDRASYLLLLGANPMESNGSLATAPDWPGRLRGILQRGGRIVVVDPKRTRTAERASEHLPIRPGTDAQFLMAMVHTLFAEGLVDLGAAEEFVSGVDVIEGLARDFPPEAVAGHCGIDAATIRRHARELATAPRAAVYGRIGTCTQEFGTLASWLVDVLNVLTGNLDRPGGAMFAKPAAGAPNTIGAPRFGRETRIGRWRSRVRGLPETFGELPVSCLAEEIETPGEGQVRALVTIAGNPALSAPNSGRLQRALGSLEFVVCVDPYVNETTRFADVILPPPSPLARGHYDLGFYLFSLRNVANYSPPVFPLGPGQLDEWQILSTRPWPTSSRSGRSSGARSRTRTRPSTSATPTTCSRSWRPAPAPSGSSTSCFGPARTGSRSTRCSSIRTGSISDRSSRGSPRCSGRHPGWSSSPPNRWWPTCRACERRSRARPAGISGASSSSVGATCAPTTRGCTTSGRS